MRVIDILNIVTVTVFGVEHRFDDGFTYGEAYWMTVCSTVVSLITNVTLIIDFVRTPNFKTSGMFCLLLFAPLTIPDMAQAVASPGSNAP